MERDGLKDKICSVIMLSTGMNVNDDGILSYQPFKKLCILSNPLFHMSQQHIKMYSI